MRASIFGGTLTLDRMDVGNLIGGRFTVLSDVSLVGAFGGNGGLGAMVSPLPADLINDMGGRGGNACPFNNGLLGLFSGGGSFLALAMPGSVAAAVIVGFNSARPLVSSLIT